MQQKLGRSRVSVSSEGLFGINALNNENPYILRIVWNRLFPKLSFEEKLMCKSLAEMNQIMATSKKPCRKYRLEPESLGERMKAQRCFVPNAQIWGFFWETLGSFAKSLVYDARSYWLAFILKLHALRRLIFEQGLPFQKGSFDGM
jgi:hypothetical protein